MIKKISLIFILIIFSTNLAFCEGKLERRYQTKSEDLFIVTLSAVSSSRFNIEEINSQKGEILFNVNLSEYLIKIVQNGSNAEIRIVPVSLNYKNANKITDIIFSKLDRKYARNIK